MRIFILSRTLFYVLTILFILVRVFFSIKYRKAENPDNKGNKPGTLEGKLNFFIRRFVIIPLLMVTIWDYYTFNPSWMNIFILPIPKTILWIITAIGITGVAFLIWVHICLGKEWYANLKFRRGHKLIKRGPYSKIRHPMYTALFTIYLSIALVSVNLLIIILIILAIISIIIRLPEEEEMLITEFGDDYTNYIKETGRFFPKL
jgi:protein-S-isoprenylcysteine O-methyltransferase Ste14